MLKNDIVIVWVTHWFRSAFSEVFCSIEVLQVSVKFLLKSQ